MALDVDFLEGTVLGILEDGERLCCLESDGTGDPLVSRLLLDETGGALVAEELDALSVALKPKLLGQESNINVRSVTAQQSAHVHSRNKHETHDLQMHASAAIRSRATKESIK